jgi:hypothetical protein
MATTLVASANSTTNATSYSSGSYTPSANKVLVALVYIQGTTTNPLTASGNGLTWTSQDQQSSASDVDRWAVFTAPTGSSPGTGTFTGACVGDAGLGAFIEVYETDADTTIPIQQAVVQGTGAGGAPPAATFGSATQSDCILLGFTRNGTNSSTSAVEPSGWTEDLDNGHATPTSGGESCHHDSPGSVTTVTWGANSASGWAAFIVELNPAAAPAADYPLFTVPDASIYPGPSAP